MKRSGLLILALIALIVVSVSGGMLPAKAADLVKVTLQLKWVDQAQFAGYYAAVEEGYYEEQGLDVTLLPGGPDVTPEQVVAGGKAEFGVDWLPSLLATRESGAKLVNVAQIYTRSGMRHISFVDKNIKTVADLKGKKVGVWLRGNQFELYAALVKNGMDPEDPYAVQIVSQPFDMGLLLKGEVDAAAAMTYNEYAQVLETINPATGKLYQESDLNVIDFNNEGTAMLQDGLFANSDWLAKEGSEEVATKFIAASLKGWAFCRDNVEKCVEYTLKRGSALPAGHQTWQMNEVNKLIWPNELGVGVMDEDAFKQTAEIALKYRVINAEPDESAHRTDLAEAALKLLGDEFDAKGEKFEPIKVELKEGGK
jgi:NitT/TauT family transport system substrate-binding protein